MKYFKIPEEGDFNIDPLIEFLQENHLEWESERDECITVFNGSVFQVYLRPGNFLVVYKTGELEVINSKYQLAIIRLKNFFYETQEYKRELVQRIKALF